MTSVLAGGNTANVVFLKKIGFLHNLTNKMNVGV